ncbi:hypothetical protein EAS61_39445 [Bradyrhizobium zhanjiangense]|uniref:Uncharacterized protein n=1 Tax=Bradyrhizobium zhanjiangense TaxID=1325107 RepID=A0A4V1KUH2_9BRAD|nr:hypothetical protein EAS61_39445 [Bradyrhizobium zhanjiangense]
MCARCDAVDLQLVDLNSVLDGATEVLAQTLLRYDISELTDEKATLHSEHRASARYRMLAHHLEAASSLTEELGLAKVAVDAAGERFGRYLT